MKTITFKIECETLKNGQQNWYLYEWIPFEWSWNIGWMLIQVLFSPGGRWLDIPYTYENSVWRGERAFPSRGHVEQRIASSVQSRADAEAREDAVRVVSRTREITTTPLHQGMKP